MLSRMGVGISLSPTLGPGAEVAYEVTHRINVRGGFNYFSYSPISTIAASVTGAHSSSNPVRYIWIISCGAAST